MNTPNTQVAETKKEVSTQVQSGPSERFTNAVVKEFSSNNGGIELTPFQRKLCQNYFIKIDQTLKDAEKKRLAKSEQYRDSLALTWENVNMNRLAVDVIAYSAVGLDPTQPNHISMIPYKNNTTQKYDLGFIIGYNGMEIKAKKYGLDVPDDVVVELVYSTDKFKQFKKDLNNKVESYTFEIINDFERGEIVGGFWYHVYFDKPEKNKLLVFSLKDIEKRKPKYASAEFWGGEKDIWENKQKVGTEKIEGWFPEMCYKTIKRHAYNAITIDSSKIDENYLNIIQKEKDFADEQVQNEIKASANKESLDFNEAAEETAYEEVPQEEQPVDVTQESLFPGEQQQTDGPGF